MFSGTEVLLNIFVSSKADAMGEDFLRQPIGQLRKGLHLRWAGDALLEIPDQTDADRPLIDLVAAYMPPILLFEPARAHLNLSVARVNAVADDKMIR